MKFIQLADGTEIQVITVNGFKETINNALRDVLEFHFTADNNSIDALAAIFADESKTREIKIVDTFENETDEEVPNQEFIHSDYVIRKGASLRSVTVAPETNNSPEIQEYRIVIEMAQQTYMEKAMSLQAMELERIKVENAEANTELFEMMVIMGGGF